MNDFSFSARAGCDGAGWVIVGYLGRFRRSRASRKFGFSLVELLIVILLMSIMAQLLIASMAPTIDSQLTSVAGILVGELGYGRSLAVGNNSSYRFDIDATNNRLIMSYTGTDTMLNTLPTSPYRSPTDPSNQYIIAMANMPLIGAPVKVLGAQAMGTSAQNVTSVEFGSYGQTTQANPTYIWLTAGSGTRQCYLSVQVNPVTGMATVGTIQTTRPAGL